MNNRKKRRRMKFKPRKLIKRLFVLAVMFAIGSGFFLLGRGAFRLVSGRQNRPRMLALAQAELVTDVPGLDADAIFLRDELVVLAEKPGRAHLLVADGAEVTAGQLVLEIVDKALLADLDAQLEKLSANDQPTATVNQNLAEVATKMAASQDSLYLAMGNYKQAVRTRAVDTYASLYQALTKQSKEIAQLQQDHARLAQSLDASAGQRQEIEERRELAIVPVHAPATGSILYWVDGLEESATLGKLAPDLWERLQAAHKNEIYQTAGDCQISAGQPVFKIVTPASDTYLLAQLTAADTTLPADWESVSIEFAGASEMLTASIVEGADLQPGQLLLKLTDEVPLALTRFNKISLHREGAIFCRIPQSALTTQDGETIVFTVEGNTLLAQAVQIVQQNKKQVIVSGLRQGATIVTKPAGLTDGQDVTDRIRK